MKFQYHNPIHFTFGPDSLERLLELCQGKKVLLVYGGGSIKRNGIYERITALLDGADIPYVDYGSQVKATWQGVLNGITLARREGVDAVVEIGGASAMAHQVSYREALVIAYLHWLKGIAKYHMADIRTLFTEVFGVDARLADAEVVEQGYARLRALMEQGGVSLSLASRGPCPTREYVEKSLAKEDYGEFSPGEIYDIIAACYA